MSPWPPHRFHGDFQLIFANSIVGRCWLPKVGNQHPTDRCVNISFFHGLCLMGINPTWLWSLLVAVPVLCFTQECLNSFAMQVHENECLLHALLLASKIWPPYFRKVFVPSTNSGTRFSLKFGPPIHWGRGWVQPRCFHTFYHSACVLLPYRNEQTCFIQVIQKTSDTNSCTCIASASRCCINAEPAGRDVVSIAHDCGSIITIIIKS